MMIAGPGRILVVPVKEKSSPIVLPEHEQLAGARFMVIGDPAPGLEHTPTPHYAALVDHAIRNAKAIEIPGQPPVYSIREEDVAAYYTLEE